MDYTINITVEEYEMLVRQSAKLDVLFEAYMTTEKPKYSDERGLYHAMQIVFGGKSEGNENAEE